MNIQFQTFGLTLNTALRACLQDRLERLQGLIPVTSAEVVLRRQPGSTLAVSVQVHLEVPGRDIQADARDHTLAAAWVQVLEDLETQIKDRQMRRESGNFEGTCPPDRLIVTLRRLASAAILGIKQAER